MARKNSLKAHEQRTHALMAAIGAAIPLPRVLSPQKAEDAPDGAEDASGPDSSDGEGERHA